MASSSTGNLVSSTAVISAACIGAAVCAVYVIWGPDHFFRKRGRCCGLVNLGNTCFINTVLQSLATMPGVEEWLERVATLHKGVLSRTLRSMLKMLNEDREGTCSPREVLQALSHHRWKINHEQQDAHELYLVLLSTLEEEMMSSPSLSDVVGMEIASTSSSGVSSRSRVWTRSGCFATESRAVSCPFRGMLTSELHCITCNHSLPLKYEAFDSISVTLPQYKCSLENCLLEFIKSEAVYDVECPSCSKSVGHPVKKTHLKKLQVGRAPACLCVHLNRTSWAAEGYLYKNNLHTAFPIHLDASPLLKREAYSAGLKYLLCAVVEHRGGPNSGHYLTYRRCGKKGREWVCTSDASVYAVTVEEVLKAKAYMLFYSRKKGPSESLSRSRAVEP